jgi:sigma-E factor negative regulatory protein RseB
MAPRRAIALCVLTVLAAVQPTQSAPVEPRDVRDWLMRIHGAASQRNFQGTFVVSAAGVMSSARIAHFVEGSNQFERIDPMDGQPRHVVRHNGLVHTLWPINRVALVERRDSVASFPSLLLGGDDRIADFYDLEMGKPERVAGHDADVLVLKPRDSLRYGHRLWAERQTHLLLRAEVIDDRGQVLEVSAFSDVSIGVTPRPELVMRPTQGLERYRVVKSQASSTSLDAEGWELRRPVAGFRQLSCVLRPLQVFSDPKPGEIKPRTLQAVYSDGITHVSVFIEPFDEERHRSPHLTSAGATQTLGSRRGNWWLTVVGDVPAATLKIFASGFERKK